VEAIRAGSSVSRNSRRHAPQHFARNDTKTDLTDWCNGAHPYRVNARKRWWLRLKTLNKRIERRRRAFNFNGYSIRVVSDQACQPLLDSETIDEWSEADPLHDAPDSHLAPLYFLRLSFWMGFLEQLWTSLWSPA
jgi:hypothetical protein